jgi:DNA-binding MarR family transcriptional regulator
MSDHFGWPSEGTLVKEVLDLLRELLHALLWSSVPVWLDLPLTLPQLRTAFVIAHNATSSVKLISQQLGVGEPTASHLVDKLVQAGLVERADDPEDRRRACVQLSPAGKDLIDKLLGWEEFLGGRLNQLSKEDLLRLERGLSALLKDFPAQSRTKKSRPREKDKETSS